LSIQQWYGTLLLSLSCTLSGISAQRPFLLFQIQLTIRLRERARMWCSALGACKPVRCIVNERSNLFQQLFLKPGYTNALFCAVLHHFFFLLVLFGCQNHRAPFRQRGAARLPVPWLFLCAWPLCCYFFLSSRSLPFSRLVSLPYSPCLKVKCPSSAFRQVQ
jgi:hypothetical protein